jgi:hypothetical protein
MIFKRIDKFTQEVLKSYSDGHKETDHLVVLQGSDMDDLLYDTTTNQYLDNPELRIRELTLDWMELRKARIDLIHREKLESGYYIYFK